MVGVRVSGRLNAARHSQETHRVQKILSYFIAPLAVAGVMLAAPSASAGNLADCGNINVEASAKCSVEIEGGCEAQCSPVSFTASCVAECSGECNASANVDCTGSCEASCTGQCEVDPGSFDCNAKCETDCSSGCQADCASASDSAQCKATCEATCSSECSASCSATPPSASCDAKCEAKCKGECVAEVNVGCQVDCHGGCSLDLQGGCELACKSPTGALFCDGQYIDHGGNLESCIEALRTELNVEVTGYADASCDDGTCVAEAGASISCALVPSGPSSDSAALVLLAGAAVGFGAVARRRSR